jgi:phosphate/sulfate permease
VIALFVIALFASHIFQSIIGHTHSSSSSTVLLLVIVVGVIALIVGLIVGRNRGLRQLGEVEFRTRLRNVRGVSRW